MTLTAAAPEGGALVQLSVTRSDIVKIPSSVLVPQGATSATFVMDISTVPTRTNVPVTASWEGVTVFRPLTVTLPIPRAAFRVTSPTLGEDACVLNNGGLLLDCRLDASPSDGRIVQWFWTLEVSQQIRQDKRERTFFEIDVSCGFVRNASNNADSNGRYVNMRITLRVTDSDGTSNITTRTVNLYTNGNCGE